MLTTVQTIVPIISLSYNDKDNTVTYDKKQQRKNIHPLLIVGPDNTDR